mgnify:FL=1|tara:strand:+ start:3963 stop:4223 length:261 start_codon:yes stop_codon:yes gene_type:complete
MTAPEFKGVGHRKVLTINQAPEHLCLLCEDDLRQTGAFDFELEVETDGEISFQGNRDLHRILSGLRQAARKGDLSYLPGLAIGAYR